MSFTFTSGAWLSWVYHLIGLGVRGPVVDICTMVAGYAAQAGGIGLCMWYIGAQTGPAPASGGMSAKPPGVLPGQGLFTGAIFFFLICCIPAIQTRFFLACLAFGCLMNVGIGVIEGIYLHVLAALVPGRHRGVVFGASYGASAVATWLLSRLGQGHFLQSAFAMAIYTAMAAAAVFIYQQVRQAQAGAGPAIPAGDPAAGPDRAARAGGQAGAGPDISAALPANKRSRARTGPSRGLPDAPAPVPARRLLVLSALVALFFSLEKNLGFSFPSADLMAGVDLELSRVLYAAGLVVAGLISDRSRKYGAICALMALITPFIMLALQGEPLSATLFWGLDYFFYGFFSVFRVLLFADLAGHVCQVPSPEDRTASLPHPASLSGRDRDISFHEACGASGADGKNLLDPLPHPGAIWPVSARLAAGADGKNIMAPLLPLSGAGLLFGRLGDAIGTFYSLGLAGRTSLSLLVAGIFFALCVFLFFLLYQALYMPVPAPKEVARPRTEAEIFDAFSIQYGLTGRERAVFRLLLQEHTNPEIAQALVLSESTVKFHVHNLLKKAGCRNRLDLFAKYRSCR